MKCDKCKEETPFWDLHKIKLRVTENGKPSILFGKKVFATKEWCPKCLGWEKKL